MLRLWMWPAVTVLLSSLSAAGQADSNGLGAEQHRIGFPVDWSFGHVISSEPEKKSVDVRAQEEPRLVYSWLRRHRGDSILAGEQVSAKLSNRELHDRGHRRRSLRVDWSFPLGSGTVAPSMSPAKFSFDVAAAPSCTNDYVVYGLNVAGSSSQPNMVRFNNLYAGTGGPCGDNPTVESAYILDGQILTSPALSLDGSKVAVIGTFPGLGSFFHVLTWGTSGNNGFFDSTSRTYNAVSPGGGINNATLMSLFYSAATTTFSAPFIDYSSVDHAYFGDDSGNLYRTTCVFHCPTGSSPQVDTGWPIQVAATNVKLSPPVLDHVSNKVFVGGSDGNLHVVDLALCPGPSCSISSVAVGSTNSFGGVLDGPIVDSTFGTVFAFAGDNGSGTGVAFQTNTSLDLAPNIAFSMGTAAFFNIYDGTPDNAYFQNTVGGSMVSGNLFVCGPEGPNGVPKLYRIPFTKSAGTLSTSNPPQLDTAVVQQVSIPGNSGFGCSPMTEFNNGTTDRLFFSHGSFPAGTCPNSEGQATGCMLMYNITLGSPIISASASTGEFGGTSGIVIDNTSAIPQTSSVYFANEALGQCSTGIEATTTPSFCAVKLTQASLQ